MYHCSFQANELASVAERLTNPSWQRYDAGRRHQPMQSQLPIF